MITLLNNRMIFAGFFVITLIAGCSGRQTRRVVPEKISAKKSEHITKTAREERANYKQIFKSGKIEVSDHDGMRVIKQGSTVLRIIRIASLSQIRVKSKFVALAKSIRPRPKSILVYQFGVGRTADSLAQAGYNVTTISNDKQIVEIAKQYFGFSGRGVTILSKTEIDDTANFDLVIWESPPHLKKEDIGISKISSFVGPKGQLLIRFLGEPKGEILKSLVQKLGRTKSLILGNRGGTSAQQLFVLSSRNPIKVFGDSGLKPITSLDNDTERNTQPSNEGETVSLLGYLIRSPGTAELALDLPRWGNGAERYLLVGKKAKALERLISHSKSLPPQSADETKQSARSVIGGGGAVFSDTRLSPIMVAVKGRSTFRYAVGPHASVRRDLDSRLPYGGVLYSLNITSIDNVLTLKKWNELLNKNQTVLKNVQIALLKGQFVKAKQGLQEYLDKFRKHFGAETVLQIQAFDELLHQYTVISKESLESKKIKQNNMSIATACDRALHSTGYRFTRIGQASTKIQNALQQCAEKHYKERSLSNSKNKERAASRLRELWSERLSTLRTHEANQLKQEIKRLEQQYGDNLLDIPPPPPL